MVKITDPDFGKITHGCQTVEVHCETIGDRLRAEYTEISDFGKPADSESRCINMTCRQELSIPYGLLQELNIPDSSSRQR